MKELNDEQKKYLVDLRDVLSESKESNWDFAVSWLDSVLKINKYEIGTSDQLSGYIRFDDIRGGLREKGWDV